MQDRIGPRIIEVIANQLSLREESITPDARFIDDLGADSLDIVELIMEMEEEFDVEIPDEEVEKMVCVKDVIDFITSVKSAD